MFKLSENQISIIGHSLGINVYHAKVSKKKRDKKLPNDFYRNRFCAGDSHDDMPTLLSLEELGYMSRGLKINNGRDILWYVTETGIDIFKQEFYAYI